MKKFAVCLIFFLLNFLTFQPSFAASNFTTAYNVTYTVRDDASTHVNFDIVLTNKSSDYYASSYNVQVGFKDMENLKASDSYGSIPLALTKNEDGQNVKLVFNKKVVGINKKINFNLSFDTTDVAKKIGKIWGINIPGLSNQNDFESFNVNIKTPSFLKTPSYIKPQVEEINTDGLSFTKKSLGRSGISIAFGEEQIYKFNLLYHLNNPNIFPVTSEIALPPPTSYQDIEIESISPKPENVKEDKDGNWLAQYRLSPSQKLNVTITGKAKIMLTPKKEVISKEKLKDYLKEQPYWQTSNSNIKNLVSTLKTPYAIYEYVVKALKYDFSRVTEEKKRLGAIEILQNPNSAVCLEFTDLFIALARAAGIPAREINGFAYTQNSKQRPLSLVKDVLHAWPEYYDENLGAWVMVDPTWGNTTGGVDYFHILDFDHLAFVIKGENSNYPVPAGGYKSLQENSKDVNVGFGDSFENINSTFTISENFSKSYLSFFPIKGYVIIKNIGKGIIDSQKVVITTQNLSPSLQTIYSPKIPPFGFVKVPVSFNKTPFLTNNTDTVTIAVAGKSISKDLKIYPFFLDKTSILGGILFVSICIILFIFAPKTRGISFFKRKR